MNKGSVIHLTHFDHCEPHMRLGYKAPKGEVFVAVLLGTADKKNPQGFDPVAAIKSLGWVENDRERELTELLTNAVNGSKCRCAPDPEQGFECWRCRAEKLLKEVG